jgi:hypothetical protein
MARVLDKNYYPMPFPGGSSMVASVPSGDNTLETHEFYNADGKVIFYWKLIKDVNGNLVHFRIKMCEKPANPAVTYKNFDSLT